jgi:hypothetical protein
MTKIICRQTECLYWEKNLCTSDQIIYDPEQGCLTFEPLEGFLLEEEEWEDEEELSEDEEEWEDEEDPFEETDQDDWDL